MFTTRLSDRVLVVSGDFLEEHLTVIDTGDGLIVVDTLATLPATRAALRLVREFSQAPVRVLVNTHLDVDHTAGNHLFAGAACVAHANGVHHLDERVFDDPASEPQIRGMVAGLEASRAGGNTDPRLDVYIPMYRSLLDGFGDHVFMPPSVFVAGGSRIAVGGTVVELYHFGPAHTDADLVAWCPAERLLVTGDALLGRDVAPTAHPGHGGSVAGLGKTARELRRLVTDGGGTFGGDADDVRVVPGHGGIGGLDLAWRQERYVESLVRAVDEARDRGLSLDEARLTVQVEEFAGSLLYDFVHPGHVELAWREAEAPG